jgi:TATA-binding protein-associated factor
MGRLGLDFLGMGDEADTEMDWDKELADGGDGEASSAADTKVESVDAEIRDAEPDIKPVQLDVHGIVKPKPTVLTSVPRRQDIKMEDSPISSPIGRPMSAGSSASLAPPLPPSASSSVFDGSVTQVIPQASQDPPVELSARERNRLKRKRKAGASAFVPGANAQSGNSSTHGNGPSGPPPPSKNAARKYSTVAAGESGSSK